MIGIIEVLKYIEKNYQSYHKFTCREIAKDMNQPIHSISHKLGKLKKQGRLSSDEDCPRHGRTYRLVEEGWLKNDERRKM